MATTLRFISSTLQDANAQRVYWKERWADPWTLMSPKLWCNSAQWTAAPSLPVAELHWRYGIALELGQQAFAARFKETNRLRQYVKVEYDTFALEPSATDPLRWYGSVEIELDDYQGAVQRAIGGDTIAFASGKNFFQCFGLEHLLDTAYVTSSVVAKAGGGVHKVNRAITFNGDGIWNMSPTPGPDGVYVFHSQVKDAAPWSSSAIAGYLLKYYSPKDFNGQTMLPFELGGIQMSALATWDTPEMLAQDKAVRELLNVLLSRQRLTGWHLVPEDTPGGKLAVTPFTLVGSAVQLLDPPALPLPANLPQYRLASERDRGKEIAIKRSTADTFDQVLVTGARRTSTATFSIYDGTLAKGWDDDLESEYEAGASPSPNYPTDVGERQIANSIVRGLDKFKPVYQRFILPPTFQYLVGDGISGQVNIPLCPSDADPQQATPLAPEDLRFAAEQARQEGYAYESLPPSETADPPHRPAKPLVIFPYDESSPSVLLYGQLDQNGRMAELPESMDAGMVWSAQARIDPDDGALWLEVPSEENHVLASADFSPLPDDDEYIGAGDFRQLLCTLTVQWSEYASAVYPEAGPAGRDAVRIFPLAAGEEFRLDYLCPQTVVSLDPSNGDLVRSEGGFIRDDRPKLLAIGKAAYAWYSVPRRALTLQTSLLNSSLRIGSYITAIGDESLQGDVHTEDINSVVTSLEIRSASAEGEGDVQPPVPTLHYETAFGELDALKFV